ncbi:MAG: TetR family transcriptional regulator [Desulfobacterales bacterium]|nr:MAG: TetR family transcriptional regulator [Desulfobacterales bacterium]
MKEKIKKSAIKLFYKKGYFATSMSTIARAIGIQKSSIYHHYPTKEDILLDIFKTTMNDLQDMLRNKLDAAKGTREKMQAAIYCHTIFHIERQQEAIIADSELRGLTARNYKKIIQMRDDYEKQIQRVLEEGVADGIFADLDIKVISYAILSMCTGVCTWFKKTGRLSKEEVADIYAVLILKGLAKS